MSLLLKQSTEITIRIGPFLDKTDGVTEETGLAGNGTELSKAGAAFGAGPTLGTHDAEGWYPITLTTTHTNTVGALQIKSHDAATHLPVWHQAMVLPANTYDSLVGGTDALDVSVIQWLGTAAATPTVAGVPEVDVTHFNGTAGTFASGRPEVNTSHVSGTAQTAGDIYARLGAPAGASMSADIAAVKSDTAAVLVDTGTDGVVVAAASKTGYALSAAGVTAVWAEVMTGTTTAVQAMRGFIAALLGKASGLETTTAVYRNVADTKDVISATVDADGNRSAVTLDLT